MNVAVCVSGNLFEDSPSLSFAGSLCETLISFGYAVEQILLPIGANDQIDIAEVVGLRLVDLSEMHVVFCIGAGSELLFHPAKIIVRLDEDGRPPNPQRGQTIDDRASYFAQVQADMQAEAVREARLVLTESSAVIDALAECRVAAQAMPMVRIQQLDTAATAAVRKSWADLLDRVAA